MAKRQVIIEQFVKGHSMAQIARSLDLSYDTVWRLCQRYKESGSDGLKPHYDNCGRSEPEYEALIYRAARCLKNWHPGWGGGRIRGLLKQKYPGKALPHPRTFQRWFKDNGQIEVKTQLPQEDNRWATRVHEVRQVDAKEHLRLAAGQQACWLNIEDEYSSAVFDPPVFPLCQNQSSTRRTSAKSTY